MNRLMWQNYFLMFRRLQKTTYFFYRQHFHVSKRINRKTNILNETLAEEILLLLRNSYILNEKQYLHPLLL